MLDEIHIVTSLYKIKHLLAAEEIGKNISISNLI